MDSEIQYVTGQIAYLERQRLICWSETAIANIDRELQEEREKLAQIEGEANETHSRGGEVDTYNTIFGGGHSEFPSDF